MENCGYSRQRARDGRSEEYFCEYYYVAHSMCLLYYFIMQQGTLILREKPLFLLPATVKQSPEHLIVSLVSQLSPEQRRQFLALSHHSNPTSIGDAQWLAKAQTNGIAAGENVGIFPKTARLNHGCSSAFNVAYNWDEEAGEIGTWHPPSIFANIFNPLTVVQAFKPIAEGEEILTSYTDTKRPRHERQQYLKEAYNFMCTCAVCSLPPQESKRSDERLVEMSRLKAQLAAWGRKEIGGEEATRIINKIWSVGEEEGYLSERVFYFGNERGRVADIPLQARRIGLGCSPSRSSPRTVSGLLTLKPLSHPATQRSVHS